MGHGSVERWGSARNLSRFAVAAALLVGVQAPAAEQRQKNATGVPLAAEAGPAGDDRGLFRLLDQLPTEAENVPPPAADAERPSLRPMVPASPPAAESGPPVAAPTRPQMPLAARTTSGGVERLSPALITNFTDQIEVPASQSVIVRLSRAAERVSIADPELADVVLVSPTEILINGRGRRYTARSGEIVVQEAQTSLIVWDKDGRADVRALYINKARLEQVELSVTVAELNRSALERQGMDFQFLNDKILLMANPSHITTLDSLKLNLTSPNPGGPKTIDEDPLGVNSDRATFTVFDMRNNFLAFIELLQRESMAKILARPTLLTRSGESAHFRSGGEVPIPLVTNNQISVQFKEFGVLVDFTPNFTDDGGVDLKVEAELSQPDTTISQVTAGGFTVPAFRSRQIQTRVRLREHQSLLIAGLIRDDEIEEEQKVPYLGDIPYLGFAFRRTSFDHNRSELMILVQPRVVHPMQDDAGASLPTSRHPLTRAEVRTKTSPNPVSRPRLFGAHRDRLSPGEPAVAPPPEP